MWRYFLGAIALMLMIEGLLPLIFLDRWRSYMARLLKQDNRTLRMIAFTSFVLGAILWFIVQHTDLF